MSITRLFNSDFKVAVLAGSGKIDDAILELEKSLTGAHDDINTLGLIAEFYYLSERPQKAIKYADKVIAIDEDNFDANALLSMIYADLNDPEFALCYIRVALENFPEPLPTPPIFMLRVFKIIGYMFGKSKQWAQELETIATNPNRHRQEWLDWTAKYLRWYYNGGTEPYAPSTN